MGWERAATLRGLATGERGFVKTERGTARRTAQPAEGRQMPSVLYDAWGLRACLRARLTPPDSFSAVRAARRTAEIAVRDGLERFVSPVAPITEKITEDAVRGRRTTG